MVIGAASGAGEGEDPAKAEAVGGSPVNGTTQGPPAAVGPAQDTAAGVMPAADSAAGGPRPERNAGTAVLELQVRNHPGVMSHITGLFARRAFNLEAIVCVPEPDHRTSRMLLLVVVDPRLEQVERQLEKLEDVRLVRLRPDLDAGYFHALQW